MSADADRIAALEAELAETRKCVDCGGSAERLCATCACEKERAADRECPLIAAERAAHERTKAGAEKYIAEIREDHAYEIKGCIRKLHDVALYGRSPGVFASDDMERAAQAIQKLREERDAAQAEAVAMREAWKYADDYCNHEDECDTTDREEQLTAACKCGYRQAHNAMMLAANGTAGRALAARVPLLEELAAADLALRHFDCPHYEPPCDCHHAEAAILARFEAALDALDPEKLAALEEKGGRS